MRPRSFSILPTSLLFATALLGACAVDPASEDEGESEPVAETQQALNGGWAPWYASGQVPCSVAEYDIIADAFVILENEIINDSSAFQGCMKNAVFSYDFGQTIETLMAILPDAQTTLIQCVDMQSFIGKDANACELNGVLSEKIAIDHGFLATQIAAGDAREVATVILHEILHDRGIHHADVGAGFGQSINEQAQNCLRDGAISGTRRSDWLKEAELAQIGGDDGEPFGVRTCLPNNFLFGQSIALNAAGNDISGFRMRCGDALHGNLHFRYVGDMTNPTMNDCGPGEVVVGVTGNADVRGVHKMGLHCAPLFNVFAKDNTVTTVLPEIGVATGPRFKRFCPPGMAVKGILGRSTSSSVEQLRLVCDDYMGWNLGEPFAGATLGVAAGTSPFTTYEVCSDRAFATRFLGTDDPTLAELVLQADENGDALPTADNGDFSRVRTLGLECTPSERSGPNLDLKARAAGVHITPLGGAKPGTGGTPGEAFANIACPAGKALIGVRTWPAVPGGVAAIEGICQDTVSWAKNIALVESTIGPFGRVRATPSTAKCPLGSFLVGLKVRAAQEINAAGQTEDDACVDQVTPICRTM
ncbi:MAG: hypothetical protein U0359_09545 [Byssovorax sp.]